MYDVMFLPLNWIDNFDDVNNTALLILSSCEVEKEKLTPYYRAHCIHPATPLTYDDSSVFTDEIAISIADYIQALPNELDTLLILGDYEDLINPAVAAAILRYKGLDEMKVWKNPHHRPNIEVYTKLCRTFGLQEAEDNTDTKIEINNTAHERILMQKEYTRRFLEKVKANPPMIIVRFD